MGAAWARVHQERQETTEKGLQGRQAGTHYADVAFNSGPVCDGNSVHHGYRYPDSIRDIRILENIATIQIVKISTDSHVLLLRR
jgi:hypothetical protein